MPYILSIRSGDSMGRNTIFFVFEHKIRMTKQKKNIYDDAWEFQRNRASVASFDVKSSQNTGQD
jgi:hypothetical protein